MTPIVILVITQLGSIFAIWYKYHLERKREKKIGNPYSYADKYAELKDIIEKIRNELGAARGALWEFHNGGKTYSGQSLQKISMRAESNRNDVDGIIKVCQSMDIALFDRNINKLRKSVYVHEINEAQHDDTLSILNGRFDISSTLIFKIDSDQRDEETGDFKPIALISFGWKVPKGLQEEHVTYIKSNLKKIKETVEKIA